MQHSPSSHLEDLRSVLRKTKDQKPGKRTTRITLNFYPEEVARLKDWAHGSSLAGYCRSRVLGRDYSRVPEVNREYLVELSRCNGLLNQIAKGINTAIRWGHLPTLSPQILEEIHATQALLNQNLQSLIDLQQKAGNHAHIEGD